VAAQTVNPTLRKVVVSLSKGSLARLFKRIRRFGFMGNTILGGHPKPATDGHLKTGHQE